MRYPHILTACSLAVVCVGCNTFTDVEFSGNTDAGGLDADDNSDNSQTDATNTDSGGDGGTDSTIVPIARPDSECMSGIPEKVASPPTGALLDDISLTIVDGSATLEIRATQISTLQGDPENSQIVSISVEPDEASFGFSSARIDVLEAQVDTGVPASAFKASGAVVDRSENVGEFAWAFTGSNCGAEAPDADRALWEGIGTVDGTFGGDGADVGNCPSDLPNVWTPSLVGGPSPLLGFADELPQKLVWVGTEGLFVADPETPRIESVEWIMRPIVGQASASPTAGDLLLTTNASSALFVWDPATGREPVPVPDRHFGDNLTTVGIAGDMIYLGDDRYLLAYERFGDIYLDRFVWNSAENSFEFEQSVDVLTPRDTPLAVDLAAFDGGWVLTHMRDGQVPILETVPYRLDGGDVFRSDCIMTQNLLNGAVRDMESVAEINGNSLISITAVNTETDSVDVRRVEFFGTLFPQYR